MADVPWWTTPILCITGLCFRAEPSSPCPANQFLRHEGICCGLCPIGWHMYMPCKVPGSKSLCFACKRGTYMDKDNNMTKCRQCSVCDSDSQYEERKCDKRKNRKCSCRNGFHEYDGKCVLEESSKVVIIHFIRKEEIDFEIELVSQIITCASFAFFLMMAIFILGLGIQKRLTKHTPVSGKNAEEETKNHELENMTLP
uniref:tumor necrosis factor receptor superfamily member 26-like n=1 Tax=Myxine glutinosa TaxID=7769 RepID=UPI00358E6181